MDYAEFQTLKAAQGRYFNKQDNPNRNLVAGLELFQVIEIPVPEGKTPKYIATKIVGYGRDVERKVESVVNEGKVYIVYTGPYVKKGELVGTSNTP